jgi:hypothetical protein
MRVAYRLQCGNNRREETADKLSKKHHAKMSAIQHGPRTILAADQISEMIFRGFGTRTADRQLWAA